MRFSQENESFTYRHARKMKEDETSIQAEFHSLRPCRGETHSESPRARNIGIQHLTRIKTGEMYGKSSVAMEAPPAHRSRDESHPCSVVTLFHDFDTPCRKPAKGGEGDEDKLPFVRPRNEYGS